MNIMKSRLGQLRTKFHFSGIGTTPIITDEELLELRLGLMDIASFCEDTNNSAMAYVLRTEVASIDSVIMAREL